MLFIEWIRFAPGLILPPPDELAAEIPAAHFTACVEEPDVLAVRDRRRRSGIAVGVHHGAGYRSFELHRPQDLSIACVDGVAQNYRARLGSTGFVGFERRQEQTIAPHRNAALAAVGEGSSPQNILVAGDAPTDRRFGVRDAPRQIGTGRLRPVGERRRSQRGEQGESDGTQH